MCIDTYFDLQIKIEELMEIFLVFSSFCALELKNYSRVSIYYLYYKIWGLGRQCVKCVKNI